MLAPTLAVLGFSLQMPLQHSSLAAARGAQHLATMNIIDRRQAAATLGTTVLLGTQIVPAAEAETIYPKVRMTTTAGVMEFELWDDVAPKHVASFLKLTKSGFYDGGAFHRIIPGFV